MSPAGWEALRQWGEDTARIEPLAGGVANDVWSVRVHGHLAVGRLGARSDADLAWETELLHHLDRAGLTVPVPIPTTDGRLFADGVVVMTYVEGGPPGTEADWRRVADTLRRLHRLTQGWPQRPGWRSSTSPTSTWCCPTMPPVSPTTRTTLLRKRRPHGKPPSAGTTSTQSSGSPKFERSEQRQRIERPHLMPDLSLLGVATARPECRDRRSQGSV